MEKISYCILLFLYSIASTAQLFLPCSPTEQLVFHQSITLNYSEAHEQAEWVYYELAAIHLVDDKVKRRNNFRADPKVSTRSASVADYKNSGFDRGHLAPAADMAFNATSMSESFYMSNMCPQAPAFNRGIWKSLEALVRSWINDNTSLFIAAGPILQDSLPCIGKNNVYVPQYFYKAILQYNHIDETYSAIAFLIPNEGSSNSLSEYTVTIDALESLTGIDFYPQLPDSVEYRIELDYKLGDWFKPSPINKPIITN
jgi:endonuclease G